MDIDAAPCDAASQCPSSVMMLQESAKNLAFDILTPISGSNATTPRDAIRAGTRALESTSCAGLTPDDRGRPAARQARRCSEGVPTGLHDSTARSLRGVERTCLACALERSRDRQGYANTLPSQTKRLSSEPSARGVPALIRGEEAWCASVTAAHDNSEGGTHTCGMEDIGGNVGGSSVVSSSVDLDTHETNRIKALPGQGTEENGAKGALAEGLDFDNCSDEAATPIAVPLGSASGVAESEHTIELGRNDGIGGDSSNHSGASTRRKGGNADRSARERDSMTWEAFLAQYTAPGRGGGERGGAGVRLRNVIGASSPPQRPRSSRWKHVMWRQATLAESPRSSRYPLDQPSNLPSWEDHGNGSDDTNVEAGTSSAPDDSSLVLPRMSSDLDTMSVRPDNIEIPRAQSFSPTESQKINCQRIMGKEGVDKFNMNPKEGINFLVQQKIVPDTAEGICRFLSTARGLSKRRLGDYFGRDNPTCQQVLSLFLAGLNFHGMSLDEALRAMVLKFRMPGEAQQIDRIMEKFSERYHEGNPGVFSSSETAYILSFSLMMLNTDMYNRNMKESEKMTETEFINNNRGIDQNRDLPEEQLRAMYRRLKAAEIRMDEGDMFEAEVITFVAPTKSGWLKKKGTGYVNKWKRHWFVLNNGVLYYFTSPQHQDKAPRCIIPLDCVGIDPVGVTDVCLRGIFGGYVKSVKKKDDGSMEQGHHRSFLLRADTELDRDSWVRALHTEVPVTATVSRDPFLSVGGSSTHSLGPELAGTASISGSLSLSATPVISAAATPIGTPSEPSQRRHNFSSIRDRPRRGALEVSFGSNIPPPAIMGWASTKSDRHENWARRYLALFKEGEPTPSGVIHFFGNEGLVKKGQRTSHGSCYLSQVIQSEIRQDSHNGKRGIALQIIRDRMPKSEIVIVPEEEREFTAWAGHIRDCCPNSTPVIATMIEKGTRKTPSTSSSVIDNHGSALDSDGISGVLPLTEGRVEDNNSDIMPVATGHGAIGASSSSSTGLSGEEVPDAKGGKDINYSIDYERMSSNDTQLPGVQPQANLHRTDMAPSAVTERDGELGAEERTTAPGSPESSGLGIEARHTARIVREDSATGTDVE